MFVSYLERGAVVRKIFRPKVARKSLVVDSGAHSFFAYYSTMGKADIGFHNVARTTAPTVPDVDEPEKVVAGYFDWVEDNYDDIDYFVELDLQEFVGQDTVQRWRDDAVKRGIGDKMLWCWHPAIDSFDEFKRFVNECPARYVGVEGVRKNRAPLQYNKLIRYAYENDCKIHGFAMVKSEYLERCPFYSVDSSSWLASMRYGCLILFKNQRLRILNFSSMSKKALMKNCVENGLTPEGLFGSDDRDYLVERVCQAVRSYTEYEEFMTTLWEKRGIKWPE